MDSFLTNSFQNVLEKQPTLDLKVNPQRHFEKNWLQNCSPDFKPHYYWRYVNDIFVLFTLPKHLEAFCNFLNGRHSNISFTTEHEKQNRMSFLDIAIIPENKTFTISVHRKPTFSGVYTHFDHFLPSTYKFGTVYTLTQILLTLLQLD